MHARDCAGRHVREEEEGARQHQQARGEQAADEGEADEIQLRSGEARRRDEARLGRGWVEASRESESGERQSSEDERGRKRARETDTESAKQREHESAEWSGERGARESRPSQSPEARFSLFCNKHDLASVASSKRALSALEGRPGRANIASRGGAARADIVHARGGSRPPSAKSFELGGGSRPPSAKTFKLGGSGGRGGRFVVGCRAPHAHPGADVTLL